MLIMPQIIEESRNGGLRSFDLPSKLFEQNIIHLSGEITQEMSYSIIEQLLYLDSKSSCEEINLYISSGGGSVYDGNGIIDIMRHVSKPVNTVGISMLASMGTQIFSSGTGTRSLLPKTRVMIHSVASGTKGKIHDMEVDFYETKELQDLLMKELASNTKGKTSLDEIIELTKRDKWLSAQETIDLGLADKIL